MNNNELEKRVTIALRACDNTNSNVSALQEEVARLAAEVNECKGVTRHALYRMDNAWQELENLRHEVDNARQEMDNAAQTKQDSIEPHVPVTRVEVVDGYQPLFAVLVEALEQAQNGKGKERHANDLPFTQQPMQAISDSLGSIAGMLFQAAKKSAESQKLEYAAARRELLGAINYLAGAVIWLDRHEPR